MTTAQRLGTLAVLGVLAAAAYGFVLELDHLGWDTYPVIVASRIENAADLRGTFTEPLMDGRYPQGLFYRPLVNATMAANWAVSGRDALGFHLTDLLLLWVSAWLVLELASQRLGGTRAAFASSVLAAVIFLLHPLQVEMLPVSARRAESLCTIFVLLALWANGLHDSRLASARTLLVSVATALAVSSKETGALILPLLLADSFFNSSPTGVRLRLRSALRRLIWPAAAVVLLVAARSFVLGGLGGHPESSVYGAVSTTPLTFFTFVTSVFAPQPYGPTAAPMRVVAWLLAAFAFWAAVFTSRPPNDAGAPRHAAPSAESVTERAVPVTLVCWLVLLSILTSLSGLAEPWYAAPFVPAFALWVAWISRRLSERISTSRDALGGTAIAALTALVCMSLVHSPLWQPYSEWTQLDTRVRKFLASVDRQLEELEAGQGGVVWDMPEWQDPTTSIGVRGASGLRDYSVQAYVDLGDRELPVRVERSLGQRLPLAESGTIVLQVVEADTTQPRALVD